MTENFTIPTAGGRAIDIRSPQKGEISIKDIAAHLSKIVRFNGAPTNFYSVAQHSVIVADHLRADPTAALYGLLHDAHEAYITDITRPVQTWMRCASAMDLAGSLSDKFDAVIFSALGLAHPLPEAIAEAVADADRRAFATECRDLLPDRLWELSGKIEPFKQPISRCWPWAEAEERFLRTYGELCILAGVNPQVLWP